MRLRIAGVCAFAVLLAVPAAGALTQQGVRTTRASEVEPAAARGYLSWSQNSLAHRNHYDVFVKHGAAPKLRVNPRGTQGFLWGGAIDGTTLVYSQFRSGSADLRFFDLVARTRSTPANVNTGASENGASLSGNRLLFRRTSFATSTERILLRDLSGGTTRQLAMTTGRAYAQPGTVAGDYATWFTCSTFSRCRVWRDDLSDLDPPVRIPNPTGSSQYAPSVTPDGTLYFVESENVVCRSVHPRLVRIRPTGARAVLVRFGRNRDPAITSPVANANGSTWVYYDRYRCGTGVADVYRVFDPGRSDLSLEMTADETLPGPGDPVVYTLEVTNNGPTTAKAATVVDTIPPAMEYVSSSPGCTFAVDTVTCALGNLAVGPISVQVTLRSCAPGDYVNRAVATSGWVDPKPADNEDEAPVTVGPGSC